MSANSAMRRSARYCAEHTGGRRAPADSQAGARAIREEAQGDRLALARSFTTSTARTGTRRTLRGSDGQVTKAEQAVAGKAPLKRNPFIQLSGGTKNANRELARHDPTATAASYIPDLREHSPMRHAPLARPERVIHG
jgi:hypothetical protein